jgi:hypothetical protein
MSSPNESESQDGPAMSAPLEWANPQAGGGVAAPISLERGLCPTRGES